MDKMEIHPDFIKFESKVKQVTKIIEDLITAQSGEGEIVASGFDFDKIDLDNFIATTDEERTNKPFSERLRCENDKDSSDDNDSEDDELDDFGESYSATESEELMKSTTDKVLNFSIKPEPESPATLDKFTFMQQLEEDANQRAKQREEREHIAQEFRKIGNAAFRKSDFERAVIMYTKALEHVKDSPILYNNRAVAYIKLKNYKRAVMDCDYVLNKLDGRNLRSWMYRAAACKRLFEIDNYKSAIRIAKELNSKQHDVIDDFVLKIEQDMF